jgi:Tol biopolymer transport system component
MAVDGSNQTNLTQHPGFDWQPQFSPDGFSILFESTRDDNYEIYIMDINGNDPMNLTNHSGKDFNAQFSTNGELICFTSNRDGDYEIYSVQPDGSNLANLTKRPSNTEIWPYFQPWPN